MNNYEIMMNGNVKIGEYAPDFEAETTMGNMPKGTGNFGTCLPKSEQKDVLFVQKIPENH